MDRLRFLALFALLALITIGALSAVLAQDTLTATTEVRINLRQLADGRTEFALQQRKDDLWGERVLLPARFLPRSVGHNDWVNSDPFRIEVKPPPVPSQQASVPPHVAFGFSPGDPTSFGWGASHPNSYAHWSRDHNWHVWRFSAQDEAGPFDIYYACKQNSKLKHLHEWQTRAIGVDPYWLVRSVAEGSRTIDIHTPFLSEWQSQGLKIELQRWCALDVTTTTVAAVLPQSDQAQRSATPPNWSPLTIHALTTTGNWSSQIDTGGWGVWQMHRADGPDAYAACDTVSGALHLKTHGGSWRSTTIAGFRAHFGFAIAFFIDHIIEDIASNCGATVSQPEVEPEPQPEQPERVDSWPCNSTFERRGNNQGGWLQMGCSRDPDNWRASLSVVRRIPEFNRSVHELLAAGQVNVSVGGRTYSFVIQSSTEIEMVGLGPGKEAVLTGREAMDFICDAHDAGGLSASLPKRRAGQFDLNFDLSRVDPPGVCSQ
jgi:hypothetical protein